jgi:hypothetical protein
VSTPKELAGFAVFIMLWVESDKCRGLGRSPKKHRSTLKPDEPEIVRNKTPATRVGFMRLV